MISRERERERVFSITKESSGSLDDQDIYIYIYQS